MAFNAYLVFNVGDNAGVTAGFGLRASYSARQRGAPDGTSRSNDFSVENARRCRGSRGESPGFARRAPSREGSGTLPPR